MFEELDFLPSSINPNLKLAIYGIAVIHLLALLIWIVLLCRSFGKKENFQSYVEQVMG